MKKFLVTMACKEISRAKVVIDYEPGPLDNGLQEVDLEMIKDLAWAKFDANSKKDLEQENSTKVELVSE